MSDRRFTPPDHVLDARTARLAAAAGAGCVAALLGDPVCGRSALDAK